MPLSEHEQRVLDQIERSLYADDPKFAASVRNIDPRARQRRRYARALAGVIVGIVLIPVGIAIGHSEIALAGLLLALLAFLYGLSAWRRGPEHARAGRSLTVGGALGARRPLRTAHPARGARPPEAKRGLMQRFEDRWNRRRDQLGS